MKAIYSLIAIAVWISCIVIGFKTATGGSFFFGPSDMDIIKGVFIGIMLPSVINFVLAIPFATIQVLLEKRI